MNKFSYYIERLCRVHSVHNVFSDFLEIVICCLSAGKMEDQYLKIIAKYSKDEVFTLKDAFAALITEMDNDGYGMKDCLGDFFMEHLSFGRNGQFFTPEPICDMMAMVTAPGNGSRVLDPACGSGRMLMSSAKVNRYGKFYGADVDRNCCMMAVINFCLNGMLGEVAWMDSLSNRFYGGWVIELHPDAPCPFVREIGIEESRIVLKIKEETPAPVPELSKSTSETPVQGSFWEDWNF